MITELPVISKWELDDIFFSLYQGQTLCIASPCSKLSETHPMEQRIVKYKKSNFVGKIWLGNNV